MKSTPRPAPKLWTKSRGPILARPYTLELALAINRLLVTPLAVLPQSEEDTVRPFEIGIGPKIRERLGADSDPKALNNAIRRYTHSQGYVIACAQPDAMRHDLDGAAVEPVSEADRLSATTRILVNIERRKKREAENAENDGAAQTAS